MLRSYKIHVCVCLVIMLALFMGEGFCRKREYGPLDHHVDIGYTSWFTGPLLSPTPVNMQPGHPAFDIALVAGANYGHYDEDWNLRSSDNQWFINPLFDIIFGLTDRIGIEFFVPMIINFKKGTSSTHLQDMQILLGFQIANDIKGEWTPDIRLDWQLDLPTGNFQKLATKRLGTDVTGVGAFQTGPVFIVHKELYLGKNPTALKASFLYLFPSNVSVKGRNNYGGGPNTRGTVHPGQNLQLFLSFEQSFGQQWGGGFDFLYIWQNKSTFSGHLGTDAHGNLATMGTPRTNQFSLAPFIECTYSSQLGSIFGAWFTVGGQNSNAFASGYYAIVYVF